MKVLLLGCGWVATIFGEKLVRSGHDVYATTRSADKMLAIAKKGFHSFLLDLSNLHSSNVKQLNDIAFDLILISVSATKKEDFSACLSKFQNLTHFLKPIKYRCAVYLSSTGIYPPANQLIDESNISPEQLNKKLYAIEQLLFKEVKEINILRLGGIFGYNRIPGKHFSAGICSVANQKANYIHADDISCIVLELYKQGQQNQLFNAVSPEHPTKRVIIEHMAQKYAYKPPTAFNDTFTKPKVVSPAKLIQKLKYKFLYPSPLDY